MLTSSWCSRGTISTERSQLAVQLLCLPVIVEVCRWVHHLSQSLLPDAVRDADADQSDSVSLARLRVDERLGGILRVVAVRDEDRRTSGTATDAESRVEDVIPEKMQSTVEVRMTAFVRQLVDGRLDVGGAVEERVETQLDPRSAAEDDECHLNSRCLANNERVDDAQRRVESASPAVPPNAAWRVDHNSQVDVIRARRSYWSTHSTQAKTLTRGSLSMFVYLMVEVEYTYNTIGT